MTVYVGRMRYKYRLMVMSHMMADSLGELHDMADLIGIDRRHFQDGDRPRYDVCQSKKKLALKNGAVEVDDRKLIEKFG